MFKPKTDAKMTGRSHGENFSTHDDEMIKPLYLTREEMQQSAYHIAWVTSHVLEWKSKPI